MKVFCRGVGWQGLWPRLALVLTHSIIASVAPLQGQSIREVFERVNHAVVLVHTSQTEYALRSSQLVAASVGGLGSGVLIGPTRVLTAAHVVQAANEVVVEFPNGEKITASVVASRQSHDVALLELEHAAAVSPVEMGDSDSVGVGDQIFVVGSPLGQAFTLTVGYVSARRTSPDMLDPLFARTVTARRQRCNADTRHQGSPLSQPLRA